MEDRDGFSVRCDWCFGRVFGVEAVKFALPSYLELGYSVLRRVVHIDLGGFRRETCILPRSESRASGCNAVFGYVIWRIVHVKDTL